MSKQKIGLTSKELVLLAGYFWDEPNRDAFIERINVNLGHGAGAGEAILNKLCAAADEIILRENRE
jgi:hypothetical protein